MEIKPCPLCGSDNLSIRDHGISCLGCGIWFGGGTLAVNKYREMKGDPYRSLGNPTDKNWIVEVWNNRVDN